MFTLSHRELWLCYGNVTDGQRQTCSSDHADSQGREACFQPELKCFAELRPLVLHDSVTCKWLNKSSPLSHCFPCLVPCGVPPSVSPLRLSSGSCSYCEMQQVGPFSFHLCLSDFKVWPQDLPGMFTGAQGVVLLLTASFRLSQYFKSHISCEGCTVCLSWPDEVFISLEDSLEVPPVGQQGLWVTWHCPNHFLEMFLVVWLVCSPTVTLSWALTLHLLCFQRLLLVLFPPEWLGFLDLPQVGVGFQADTGYLLETLPGLRKKLPHQWPVGSRGRGWPRGLGCCWLGACTELSGVRDAGVHSAMHLCLPVAAWSVLGATTKSWWKIWW